VEIGNLSIVCRNSFKNIFRIAFFLDTSAEPSFILCLTCFGIAFHHLCKLLTFSDSMSSSAKLYRYNTHLIKSRDNLKEIHIIVLGTLLDI
jgi:hypothetical protein